MEGLNLKKDSDEGKLFSAILDTLNDMALTISDMDQELDVINEELDAIGDELTDVEEDIYGDEDDACDCGCEDAWDPGWVAACQARIEGSNGG